MKMNSFSFMAMIVTLSLAGGVATATGCGGPSAAALCKDVCACERCTSNDLETCEAQGNKASDDADAAGCSSQFDDAVSCAGTHVSCNGEQADFKGCDAELAALSKCSSGIHVFGQNDCEAAAASVAVKFESCGGTGGSSGSSGGAVECTAAAGAQLLCTAACVDAAGCSLIIADPNNPPTAEEAKAFLDCITSCQSQ